MKTFALTVLVTLASAGLASAQMGNPVAGNFPNGKFHSCAHNNSKHCQDARKAFAEHHNGMSPEQWDNQYYQGHRGRWVQHDKDWAWEGSNGEQYRKVHDKWEWMQDHKHHHDDDNH